MNTMFLKTKEKTLHKVVSVEISLLHPNRSQPRKEFDDEALNSLAQSIVENGIIQPICVRRDGALYEIISGERRTRAAKIVGITEVPCIIMDADEEKSAVLALIENIQRRDLSFFEEALAIEKLISFYGLTQEQAASRLGKAQSTIANKLRLLRFTDEERNLLIQGNVSERQARTLVRLENITVRKKTLQKVVSKGLNLEQTEQLVNEIIESDSNKIRANSNDKIKMLFPKPSKLYINSINKLIRQMREAHIPCEATSNTVDGYFECVIRIPIS